MQPAVPRESPILEVVADGVEIDVGLSKCNAAMEKPADTSDCLKFLSLGVCSLQNAEVSRRACVRDDAVEGIRRIVVGVSVDSVEDLSFFNPLVLDMACESSLLSQIPPVKALHEKPHIVSDFHSECPASPRNVLSPLRSSVSSEDTLRCSFGSDNMIHSPKTPERRNGIRITPRAPMKGNGERKLANSRLPSRCRRRLDFDNVV